MSNGEKLKLNWHTVDSLKPKISILAWECPACGCGVRGDVEVCPNCVKNKTELKVIREPFDTYRQLFSEIDAVAAAKGVDDGLKERLRSNGNHRV